MAKKKRVQVSFSDHAYGRIVHYAKRWDIPVATAAMVLAVMGTEAKDREENPETIR